jgi:hypothetical protein
MTAPAIGLTSFMRTLDAVALAQSTPVVDPVPMAPQPWSLAGLAKSSSPAVYDISEGDKDEECKPVDEDVLIGQVFTFLVPKEGILEEFSDDGMTCLVRDLKGTVHAVPRERVLLPKVPDEMDWLSSDDPTPVPAPPNPPLHPHNFLRQATAFSAAASLPAVSTAAPRMLATPVVWPPPGLGNQGEPAVTPNSFPAIFRRVVPAVVPVTSSDEEVGGTIAVVPRPFSGTLLSTTPAASVGIPYRPVLAIRDPVVVEEVTEEWESVMVVHSWEEECPLAVAVNSGPVAPTIVPCVSPTLHATTRIPGMEGLLPDTGAVDDLCGSRFAERQSTDALQHGHKTTWHMLAKPKGVSGVGDNAKMCTHRAVVPGCLEDGTLLKYCPAVIPESDIPPLLGVNTMADLNVYFGTKLGHFVMVPHGSEDQIKWPAGSKFIQMRKAPSGHWLLIASAWNAANNPSSRANL